MYHLLGSEIIFPITEIDCGDNGYGDCGDYNGHDDGENDDEEDDYEEGDNLNHAGNKDCSQKSLLIVIGVLVFVILLCFVFLIFYTRKLTKSPNLNKNHQTIVPNTSQSNANHQNNAVPNHYAIEKDDGDALYEDIEYNDQDEISRMKKITRMSQLTKK